MEFKGMKSKLIQSFGNEAKVLRILDKMKKEAKPGEIIYDFSIGSPDGIPETEIVETMEQEIGKDNNHRYANRWGHKLFNESVANWYKKRYDVSLDPKSEIIPLAGARRTIIDMAMNFVSDGEGVLVPNISYPTYRVATKTARGVQHEYRLDPKNDFKPVYEDMDRNDCKLLFANYPHNPTGSAGGLDVYENISKVAKKTGVIVCHDNAYGEIVFDGRTPTSFLQAKDAKSVGVEIFTFSKLFNIAGWRIACMVGNPDIIHSFGEFLVDFSTGVYTPIQIAAAKALDVFFDRDIHNKQSKLYQERRDFAVKELNKKGWKCFNAQGTMYIWAELPIKDSLVFVKKLWEDKRVMLIPGVMYGDNLGKYVRLALVGGDLEYLKNALNQIPSIDSPLYDC